ncbi:MAG: tRNA (adenine-N1)-methyltransferase [Euryarchaeota archaeon]|nr:tRNA (adenine-N1)-methyltransferase [Euryarchaeota archaeon]
MPQEADTTGTRVFERGDRVVLLSMETREPERRKHLIELTGDAARIVDIGIVDTARLEGVAHGAVHRIGVRDYRLLPPSTIDLVETVKRKAQIVTPKDAARILLLGDIVPGARVVEAGIGSAALTIALARAVGPTGQVYNYEIRDDFQRWGKDNLERAGLADRVKLHLGDPSEGIHERDVDAVVMDMPTPWSVVPAAKVALRPGGAFIGYSPVVEQMEQTVKALRDAAFFEVEASEVLERRMMVLDLGARPDFSMLGHTGYLTVGRSPGPEA